VQQHTCDKGNMVAKTPATEVNDIDLVKKGRQK
jgi:hypothetical protein